MENQVQNYIQIHFMTLFWTLLCAWKDLQVILITEKDIDFRIDLLQDVFRTKIHKNQCYLLEGQEYMICQNQFMIEKTQNFEEN